MTHRDQPDGRDNKTVFRLKATPPSVADDAWKPAAASQVVSLRGSQEGKGPAAQGNTVAVMMTTYNGEQFLEKQIASIRRQSHAAIDLWVSDDGSSDRTLEMLVRFGDDWNLGRFQVLQGPASGFSENFRSLIVNPDIEATYFAFADQDDLWDEDKLEAAVAWLAKQPASVPALYCSRTRTIDENDQEIGLSPLFHRPPDFRNAIVQSIAGGNTMVMNRAARQVLAEASRRSRFVSHDWWAYMVITGVGGKVHYSATPRIGYRQHAENIVGANNSFLARLQRYSFLVKGGFSNWTETNLNGLRQCQDMLTPECQQVLLDIQAAHDGGLIRRMAGLRRSGAYRQTSGGHLGLYIACLLKKL